MDIFKSLWNINKKRKSKNSNFSRRLLKLTEEVGEVCQAYYSLTSKSNNKNKTWDDVREELVDVILIATDLLMTEMPDEKISSEKYQYIKTRIENEMLRKMKDKWEKSNDD